MASRKEINDHLKIALKEIGKIEPWFDERFNVWIFSHKKYPDVEYAGNTKKEVIENYPKYLKEFIKYRLDDKIDPLVEKKTKGHGGKREGAGRPVGTKKGPTKRVTLPKDVAEWIERPNSIPQLRELIAKSRH